MQTGKIQIELESIEYKITFHLRPRPYPNQVWAYITMENKSSNYPYQFRSIEETVERSNLLDLCEYLINHIEQLKTNSRTHSHTYMDYDLLYKVTALWGEYDKEENVVYFSILFLINVGHTEQAKPRNRIWMGGELRVTNSDIIIFADQLKTRMKDLNDEDSF